MIKKLTYLSCLLLILIPCAVYAGEYSLDELYRLALDRSETIKIVEEDLYISKRGKDKALAALLPTLSAFRKHTRYSEGKRGTTFILQPEYSNSWGLRLDQSFALSGRELTAFNITRKTIIKSTLDLDAVKEEYLLRVASVYYDVLKAKKALEIANANVNRLTKHRDAASIRLRVGEVTKTVLLRAEAELSGAQSDLIKAENTVRLAKTILARTVGIYEDYDVKENKAGISSDVSVLMPADLNFLIKGCKLSTIGCLKKRALKKRAEIKAFAIKNKIAVDEVRYAKGSYWPTLSLHTTSTITH
ncbi:MAG: TolC family protein, partial [Candidatus Mariimomonas ferrooxydans]